MFFDNIDVSTLPVKIKSKNLLSAIIELRFDKVLPVEEIAWPLYVKMKDTFNSPQPSPIYEIPKEMRMRDSNLKDTILFMLESKDGMYQVGCGEGIVTISLGNFNYRKWKNFYTEFEKVFNEIGDGIKQINRVGVRYINVFDDGNLDSFKIDLLLNQETLKKVPLRLNFDFELDERIVKLNLLNKAQYKFNSENRVNAVVLDIDVIYNQQVEKDNIQNIIEDSHSVVKKTFFGICCDDFIQQVLCPCKEEDN